MKQQFFLLTVAALFSSSACAEPITQADVSLAQGRMGKRIMDSAEKYAKTIHLDQDYISYCNMELHLKTADYPANGFIPFGVNYNQIADSEKLAIVIYQRETYERSFIFLCLANAKNALRTAEH